MIRERELIGRLRRRLPVIGDDAAVVDGGLLLCADAVVAGIHADLDLVGLDDLGWKAVASCVSDIAAMGGRPAWALVTVSGSLAAEGFDALTEGVLEAADAFGCPVVGGDLTGGPGLVVSVSVVGRVEGAPVLRSGARPGDVLWVTGPLGRSAAGLALLRAGRGAEAPDLVAAHARPRARLAEGEVARGAARATAMIDLSDGLATDLRHLADESGVGVVVEAVPVAAGAEQAEALGGGEDYELLFATPPDAPVEAAFADAGLRPPIRIGRCTAEGAERRLGDGPLPEAGYEHDLSAPDRATDPRRKQRESVASSRVRGAR